MAALTLDPDLSALAATSVYLVVVGIVFAESGILLGFFLPGDTLLFAAGLLAAQDGAGVSLAVLLVAVPVAAVAGDAVGYLVGARAGRPLLERRAERRVGRAELERAERFYDRFGPFAIVAARWIPWVRTFAPLLAGVARMPYPRFLAANVAGALTWGAGLLVVGYLAASVPVIRYVAYGIAATSVLASGVGFVVRRRARR